MIFQVLGGRERSLKTQEDLNMKPSGNPSALRRADIYCETIQMRTSIYSLKHWGFTYCT